ncbi:MAG: hypothetical protein GY839_10480 [candidate division Zixibacteria bacterium]|nr:hypothetical protein [candidate division Zixibacteria bacterium]
MPLKRRHSIKHPATFFITTSTHDEKPFPQYPESLEKIEDILFETVEDKSIILMGYVIMPTHIHLIAGSNKGGPGISKFMHSLKGRIRKNLIDSGKFWQDRFDDLWLKTEKQFEIKLNYIHYNPIKAVLVDKPEDWPYSSYLDWLKRDGSRGIVFSFDWLE